MRAIREFTADTIDHAKVKRMHDYWLAKRGQLAMPRRSDIDPLELRDCLGNLCLLDVTRDQPPRFKFRLDGSVVALATGFDLTGKFVDEVPDAAYRDFMAAIYRRVVESKAPLFLVNEEDWKGYPIRVTSVTLPLSSDGETVDAILDAVFPAVAA
jgi:hypothetical protein